MNRLARIPDRYKALLKINEIALSEPTAEAVFRGMCEALQRLLPYDRAALTLYDPDHDSLRIQALHGRWEKSVFRVGFLLPRRSSRSGWTFEHRRPTIQRDLSREFQFLSEKQTLNYSQLFYSSQYETGLPKMYGSSRRKNDGFEAPERFVGLGQERRQGSQERGLKRIRDEPT